MRIEVTIWDKTVSKCDLVLKNKEHFGEQLEELGEQSRENYTRDKTLRDISSQIS